MMFSSSLDRFPVSQLPERYGLKSRQSLYDRLKFLNIHPSREGNASYVNGTQLQLLDSLNEHLKTGEPMGTFICPVDNLTLSTGQDEFLEFPNGQFADFIPLVEAIAKLNPPKLLARHYALEDACINNWLLTSKEVHHLIGSKPKGEVFQWGGWLFCRSGKAGRSLTWQVLKRRAYLLQPLDNLSKGDASALDSSSCFKEDA